MTGGPSYLNIRQAVCLILLFVHGSLHSQQIGFEIMNQQKSWSFPFENYNNLIVVPVILNNTIPLKFILDTGVRTTILTEKTFSDLINVSYDRVVTIAGAGKIREINAYQASNITLTLPGIEGKGQSLIVLEEDYLELRNHLGANVHGILGYEFFNQFVVSVDYIRKEIVVYEAGTYKPGKRFSVVPFELIQARPYISTQLTQGDGSVVNAKFLIDSGASHSLLIELDSNDELIIPKKRYETIIGHGLGGELYGFLGRLPLLEFSEFSFSNILVSYVTDFSDPEVSHLTLRNGSIGGDILSRFTTVYDYNEKKIYLRSNKHLKNPFEFNMSGIEIISKGLNFNTFEVTSVNDHSPGQLAGVMVGDILLKVNGLSSADITLSDINWLFRTKPGRKITLLLDRHGTRVKVKFQLERLV